MIEFLTSINEKAASVLTELNMTKIQDGRYELADGIYVNVESYVPQYRSQKKYESHKKYVDVQYIISGAEIITVASINECVICERYDVVHDVVFYSNNLFGLDHILFENQYLVLKPIDAHMPCIQIAGYEYVKKAVVKIPIEMIMYKTV